jgi:hypothetical protein
MEANNKPKLEEEHGKAYAVAEEDAATTNHKMMMKKHLSDDDESAAGEPEENYRGWKAMPYVIGQCSSISIISISAAARIYLLFNCTCTSPLLYNKLPRPSIDRSVDHRHSVSLLVDDDRCPL